MIRTTNRKAISSIIGSAVFLVLMISGFATFLYAMDVSSDRFSEQLSSSFEETLRGKEKFSFTPSVDNSNKLFVRVDNEGSESLNVVDVWISNPDNTYTRYDVAFQDAHVAPNEKKQVLANHPNDPITLANGIYDVKVVTELGTSAVKKLIAPLNPLEVLLTVSPNSVGTGHNVTTSMIVHNRGNSTVFNVSPVNNPTNMLNPTTAFTKVNGPSPSTINSLEPEESVTFTWTYQMSGALGNQVVFTNTATGTDSISGDTVTASPSGTAKVAFVQVPSSGGLPSIHLMIPAPFGITKNDNEGLWAVTVANPLDDDITVSRIVIAAIDNVGGYETFKPSGECEMQSISPTLTGSVANPPQGNWDCPSNNLLIWDGPDETVSSGDALPFMVRVEDGATGNGDDPAVNIIVTVFTSAGPAIKKEGVTSMSKASVDQAQVQIWSSSSGNSPSVATSTIIPYHNDIASASLMALNVTVAETSSSSSADDVESGATLTVNIPSGFTVLSTVASSQLGAVSSTTFSDGTVQLKTSLTDPLGNSPDEEAENLKIRLRAPTVTKNALYSVFATMDGVTSDSNETPVFPSTEIIIQVCPTGTSDC